MGIVRMGAPSALIMKLRDLFDVQTFVEAGTYQGGTTSWAAKQFAHVLTIENSQILYEQTKQKYQDISNIDFLFGDTRNCLKELVPTLDKPAIFWLDSHWCGGESYGESDQCPLIEELNIINQSSVEHILLIDDARLFLAPPPLPNDLKYWPPIDQVIDAIKENFSDRYIVIQEDVIIATPSDKLEVIENFCQTVATQEWKNYGEKLLVQQKMTLFKKYRQFGKQLFGK